VNKDNNFFLKQCLCFLSGWNFYEDFDMNFDEDGVLYLHDDSVPVHSRFENFYGDIKYIDAQKKKVFIAGY
jgi:hypothetical protein